MSSVTPVDEVPAWRALALGWSDISGFPRGVAATAAPTAAGLLWWWELSGAGELAELAQVEWQGIEVVAVP